MNCTCHLLTIGSFTIMGGSVCVGGFVYTTLKGKKEGDNSHKLTLQQTTAESLFINSNKMYPWRSALKCFLLMQWSIFLDEPYSEILFSGKFTL